VAVASTRSRPSWDYPTYPCVGPEHAYYKDRPLRLVSITDEVGARVLPAAPSLGWGSCPPSSRPTPLPTRCRLANTCRSRRHRFGLFRFSGAATRSSTSWRSASAWISNEGSGDPSRRAFARLRAAREAVRWSPTSCRRPVALADTQRLRDRGRAPRRHVIEPYHGVAVSPIPRRGPGDIQVGPRATRAYSRRGGGPRSGPPSVLEMVSTRRAQVSVTSRIPSCTYYNPVLPSGSRASHALPRRRADGVNPCPDLRRRLRAAASVKYGGGRQHQRLMITSSGAPNLERRRASQTSCAGCSRVRAGRFVYAIRVGHRHHLASGVVRRRIHDVQIPHPPAREPPKPVSVVLRQCPHRPSRGVFGPRSARSPERRSSVGLPPSSARMRRPASADPRLLIAKGRRTSISTLKDPSAQVSSAEIRPLKSPGGSTEERRRNARDYGRKGGEAPLWARAANGPVQTQARTTRRRVPKVNIAEACDQCATPARRRLRYGVRAGRAAVSEVR